MNDAAVIMDADSGFMNVNVKFRQWLWNGLRLVVVAGIFAYLFYSGQFDLAKLRVVAQSPLTVVAATLLFLVGLFISVERWKILPQRDHTRDNDLDLIEARFSCILE